MTSVPAHDATLVRIGRPKTEARAEEERRARWAGLHARSALVYVENRCHLKCEHCYESEESHPTHLKMSADDYERVFDELAGIGVLRLALTGGEIFLRKDILDIVAHAKQRRFFLTLYTSGTLIDEKKADRLAELKVNEVHISVYSHEPEVHDRFTGVQGSHAKSVRALQLLNERGITTVLKSNLTTFNVDSFDELTALATSLGAEWQLDPTVRARMDGDTLPLQYALSPEQLRRKVLSRPDLAAHFRQRSAEQVCEGMHPMTDDGNVMCAAAQSTLAVGADGSVLACGFFPVAAGNLKERSLADIWYGSEQLDQVRRKRFETMTACPTCDVKSTCSPCMAQSVVEHGDMGACNDTSRRLAEGLRDMAHHKARANEKMSKGRSLPLVETRFEPPGPRGRALTVEP